MRLGYADPPYIGQSAKHYSQHPDYDGEVLPAELFHRLSTFDGWVLHTSSPALPQIIRAADSIPEYEGGPRDYRIMAWVKPVAAFKRNVSVAYAWEPVLVKAARKPTISHRIVMRDWISEPIAMKRGLVGAKPEAVCMWGFEMMGAQPSDELCDLFPGTGAVTRAWDKWRSLLDKPLAELEKQG